MFEFIPKPRVAPLIYLVLQGNLYIIPAEVFITHRAECKTTRMIGIDQFMADRGRLGQNAKPAKGINAFKFFTFLAWNGLAGHAVKSVTASNKIAIDTLFLPIMNKGHRRCITGDIVKCDALCHMDCCQSRLVPCLVKICGDLCLAINCDVFLYMFLKINPKLTPCCGDKGPFMGKPFA